MSKETALTSGTRTSTHPRYESESSNRISADAYKSFRYEDDSESDSDVDAVEDLLIPLDSGLLDSDDDSISSSSSVTRGFPGSERCSPLSIPAGTDFSLHEQSTSGASSNEIPGTSSRPWFGGRRNRRRTVASTAAPNGRSSLLGRHCRFLFLTILRLAKYLIVAILLGLILFFACVRVVPPILDDEPIRVRRFIKDPPKGLRLDSQIQYMKVALENLPRQINYYLSVPQKHSIVSQLQIMVSTTREFDRDIAGIRKEGGGVRRSLEQSDVSIRKELRAALASKAKLTVGQQVTGLLDPDTKELYLYASRRRIVQSTVNKLWCKSSTNVAKDRSLKSLINHLEHVQRPLTVMMDSLEKIRKLVEITKVPLANADDFLSLFLFGPSLNHHRALARRQMDQDALHALAHASGVLHEFISKLSVELLALRADVLRVEELLAEEPVAGDGFETVLAFEKHLQTILMTWRYYSNHWGCLAAGKACLDAREREHGAGRNSIRRS